jgi:hypothetical protein
MGVYSDYFINGTSLQDATAVYTNEEMTTLAPTGLYSNGLISREQGLDGLGPATVCPTCSDVFCEENIAIEPTAPSKIQLDYKMGDTPGAIKITIVGVNSTAIGLNLKVTPSGGTFNSFSSIGDSGISNNVIVAPDNLDVSYFYPSTFRTTCSNWDNGVSGSPISPSLETYSYNPSSGQFMPTGLMSLYPLTNRLASGLPADVGDLIAYVPKTEITDEGLSIKSVFTCPNVGRPMVVVECPVTLHTEGNFSLTGRATSALACAEGLSAAAHAHGKVRSLVDGEFMNGDYIFSTVGSVYTKLVDGYYKSVSTNFPESSATNCTFYSTDGIISQVTDC